MLHEGFAIKRDEIGKRTEIMIEQLQAQRGWEVGLGVEQNRGDVILQCAFASALVIDEERRAVPQHDVARLEVAI